MMAPPAGPPPGEQSEAKESLDKAKKLIEDLDNRGYNVQEAKSWYDQADEMFRGGLYRTSLIYSGYALDAAEEVFEHMKTMLVKITKVKSRANEMLGKDHQDMPKVVDLIEQMKTAVNEGRLEDAQELVNAAETLMRGGSSPYLAVETVGVATVSPSRGYTSCPSCGNIIETTWVKCQYCDADLQDEAPVANTGPQWAEGVTGPLMVADTRGPVYHEMPEDETEVDEALEEDTKEMEKVEEEVKEVENDLKQEDDIQEMERVEAEVESVETDLQHDERTEAGDADLKCPECGEDIDDDFVKCPVCKHPLR